VHRLTGAGDGAPKRYPAKFGRSWICSPPVGRKLKLRSHTTCRFVRSSAILGGRQQIDSGQILTDVRWREAYLTAAEARIVGSRGNE
jgi:hypothetical protein